MKKFFENKLNTVLTVILGVLILTLLGHSVISAHTADKETRRIYF